MSAMDLREYRWRHRADRSRTSDQGPRFVVQHHEARSDRCRLRLEIDGVLVSWTIPKGPSIDPKHRGMARRIRNHPLEDEASQAVVPDGEFDAGHLIVWDHGTYVNQTQHEMTTCLGRGHLSFRLDGKKLRGRYALTRVREGEKETWLLMTRSDTDAGRNPVRRWPVELAEVHVRLQPGIRHRRLHRSQGQPGGAGRAD